MIECLGKLKTLRRELAGWAAEFDPALVPAADCDVLVKETTAIKNIAATVEAMAAARVAETSLWRGKGDKTAAEWLARRSGTTANQAREAIDTGQRLGDLDATSAAAREGKLSPQQASAISDAAKADPSAEQDLLGAAERESLGELRDRCRRTKAAVDPDPDATYSRLRKQRSARSYTDGDGAWNLHARNTPEAGAEFGSVWDDLTDQIFNAAYREGRRESRDAYAADALLEMARRARDGHTGDASDADDGQRRRRRNERFLAIIRADLDALLRGTVEAGELCEIAGYGPFPVSAARRLLGDSIVKLVLTKGADVVNVTHLGRGPRVAEKIALLWSQPLCEVEGCSRRARLEADHLEPFANVHETSFINLGHKCEHHHDLKTHHGWDLIPGTGPRPMVPPDHPLHPRSRPRPPEATEGPSGDTRSASDQSGFDFGSKDPDAA